MTVSELLSRRKNRAPAPNRAGTAVAENRDPLLTLHREMNRLFDDIWSGFAPSVPAFAGIAAPNVDLVETDEAYTITAELPGVDEKDIEILFADNVVTLRGEKKSEREDEQRQLSERYYGRFERRIPLAVEIDDEHVEATFKNGVLTVVLPKSKDAQRAVRRIPLTSK
jgi:HSP20 family protein